MVSDEGRLRKTAEIQEEGLRKIFGFTRNPDSEEYKRRKNSDIGNLFNRPNIQNILISKRIGSDRDMHNEQIIT